MGNQMDIALPDDTKVPGGHPFILIGPNGAGKTRLGATIARLNQGDRIPALRNLQVEVNIPMGMADQMKTEVDNQMKSSMKSRWLLANEINQLMSKLMAENAESAVAYRDKSVTRPGDDPEETKLMRLNEFWHRHFPGRELDLSTYAPKAKSTIGKSEAFYPVQQMSDGERVALYLAARVVDAPEGLIVVDEPDVHFHSVLARQVWDDLEDMRPDCRFVYVTHDLPFAISRRPAQFGIVKSEDVVEVLPLDAGIPEDVFRSVLGAASFSVIAKRIVFCEGVSGGKIDHKLYEAWFDDPDTAVIPVGSCEEVVQSVAVFNSVDKIKGVKAIGIIDRDYWPDSFFNALPPEINVLEVHEVESLFCLPKVFEAIGIHLHVKQEEIAARYEGFLTKAKDSFGGLLFNKQVLERVRRRVSCSTMRLLNDVKPDEDLAAVKAAIIGVLDPKNWAFDPLLIFDEEEKTLRASLNGSAEDLLRLFPGKAYLGHAATELGVKADRLIQLVCSALSRPEEPEKPKGPADSPQSAALKTQLIEAMRKHLPSRTE